MSNGAIPHTNAVMCLSCGVVSDASLVLNVCPKCASQGLMPLREMLEPYLNTALLGEAEERQSHGQFN